MRCSLISLCVSRPRVCFVLWVGPAGLFRSVPDLGKGLSRVVFDLVWYLVRTSF